MNVNFCVFNGTVLFVSYFVLVQIVGNAVTVITLKNDVQITHEKSYAINTYCTRFTLIVHTLFVFYFSM